MPKLDAELPDWAAALRYGSLQFAVAVLGNAIVGHITDGYTVADLSTGTLHVVTERGGVFHCIPCESDNDDHTAVVRLYLARLRSGAINDLAKAAAGRKKVKTSSEAIVRRMRGNLIRRGDAK